MMRHRPKKLGFCEILRIALKTLEQPNRLVEAPRFLCLAGTAERNNRPKIP